jgi:hypothetical protein
MYSDYSHGIVLHAGSICWVYLSYCSSYPKKYITLILVCEILIITVISKSLWYRLAADLGRITLPGT